MSLKVIPSLAALAGLVALAPALDPANAMPAPRVAAVATSPLEAVRYLHRRHHHAVRPADPRDDQAEAPYAGARAGYDYGPSPSYGGFANTQNGAPFDNEFDPTRPYGGQAAITAPPGTAAYAEQANERRYFCVAAPERC